MNSKPDEGRRNTLRALVATGVAGGLIGTAGAVHAQSDAGTPRQFEPKNPPDPNPLENELQKYPRCPYCGMDRKQWHHSRHLVHYEDNVADGTCSIHCAAISLALNLDRVPKAIYAADFGSSAQLKPMIAVDSATYLIGSDLKPTMSTVSKMAFASRQGAEAAQREHGGGVGSFDDALRSTYQTMAEDTIMIRKRREERRRKAAGG